jgi:hypothetical protein
MNDMIAIILANVIAGALYILFSLWLKIKSPFLWLGIFMIFFPQIEAINSPGERIWPILGAALGIIGIVIIVRIAIGASKRNQSSG